MSKYECGEKDYSFSEIVRVSEGEEEEIISGPEDFSSGKNIFENVYAEFFSIY